jgi:hypothetical protein
LKSEDKGSNNLGAIKITLGEFDSSMSFETFFETLAITIARLGRASVKEDCQSAIKAHFLTILFNYKAKLLKAVQNLFTLLITLRTPRTLLSKIAAKISKMSKMKVAATITAVGVARQNVAYRSKK